MVSPRRLRNPPITEALIDIRAKLPPDADLGQLASLQSAIGDQYPSKEEIQRRELTLEFQAGESLKAFTRDVRALGYRFKSQDGKQIAQFKLDGFTLNRLKPYESWEQLRDESRRLWALYVNATSPEAITRVALRYINHLEIPLPIKDFGDYLTAPPIVPEVLPQGISSFLTRVVIHEPSLSAVVIITQALEAIIKPGIAPIILDIDVFKEAQFEPMGKDAWELLEELRVFKNRIFFESITEKTVELFA